MTNDETISHRVPEPFVETAPQYHALAKRSFKKSDDAFAKYLADPRILPFGFEQPVIDMGCGTGIIAKRLSLLRPDLKIVCFDLSSEMLGIAETEARKARISSKRMTFRQGDMTKLPAYFPELVGGGAVIVSNTAIHEVPENALNEIIAGVAVLVGQTGGCRIRDLRLPGSLEQAEKWMEEVLKGNEIPQDERALFKNSLLASYTPEQVKEAVKQTSLKNRQWNLEVNGPPNSRYWTLDVRLRRLTV